MVAKLGRLMDYGAYVVDLDDTVNAQRADAEYFQPKYKKLLGKMWANARKLCELAPRQTLQNSTQKNKEYNYIEISDINAGTGEAGNHVVESSELPANAKLKINGGELVISKVRPTRGAIAIIPEDWQSNFVASGAFAAFKLESPLREYVQVVLRSFLGKLQLERPTTGTSYPTVTDKDVENLVIPILPKATQIKIAELVKQSHEAR
ncbi:MAG TPA: restriction endonuclease subunit S [Candidatus Saccharimonadales bacterium]|jgi:type I restriction enzyme S subunit